VRRGSPMTSSKISHTASAFRRAGSSPVVEIHTECAVFRFDKGRMGLSEMHRHQQRAAFGAKRQHVVTRLFGLRGIVAKDRVPVP
jgi:acyl CoA:acetate/3-ketoacid CoA transferase beta subunit